MTIRNVRDDGAVTSKITRWHDPTKFNGTQLLKSLESIHQDEFDALQVAAVLALTAARLT